MVTMKFSYLLLALSLVSAPFAMTQDDLELRVQVLEAEVVQITDNVEDVENDVSGIENDVSQNTGQLFEVMNDVDDIDDLTFTQEVRIGALEEENSLLVSRLGSVEEENSALRAELDGLKLMIQALNETVSGLDSDNSTNERLDALESDVTTIETDIVTLNGDVTILESDVTSLGNDVSTQRTDITNLEGNLTALDLSTDQRLDDLEENNGGNEDYSDTAFLATNSAGTFIITDPIVFDLPIINPRGHYNPESGIYTIPVDGIYQFVMHYMNYNDTNSMAYLQVDNGVTALAYNQDDAFTSPSAEMTILLSLTSGQQVWLSPSNIGEMYGSNTVSGAFYSWFSGHLVYPL